jgi:uncharacterized protein (TIGR02466 family)
MKKHDIIPLFSSPLILSSVDEDTEELHRYKDIEDYRVLENIPNVKNILLQKFKDILPDLGYDNEFMISTSWFKKIEKGSLDRLHYHKNSFYSGVYYFDEYDENSGGIEFMNPLLTNADYQINPKNPNQYNIVYAQLPVKRKKLILFPSFLQHRILYHNSGNNRYSLAFNIIPLGKYGTLDSSIDTSWIYK